MASDLSEISDKSEYPTCSVILLTSRRYWKSEEFWQNSSDNYLMRFALQDVSNADLSIFTGKNYKKASLTNFRQPITTKSYPRSFHKTSIPRRLLASKEDNKTYGIFRFRTQDRD